MLQELTGLTLNDRLVIAISSITKMFVGELVETGAAAQQVDDVQCCDVQCCAAAAFELHRATAPTAPMLWASRWRQVRQHSRFMTCSAAMSTVLLRQHGATASTAQMFVGELAETGAAMFALLIAFPDDTALAETLCRPRLSSSSSSSTAVTKHRRLGTAKLGASGTYSAGTQPGRSTMHARHL